MYSSQHINESKALHKYVMNKFLVAHTYGVVWIHWCVVNCKSKKKNSSDMKSRPPKICSLHTYVVLWIHWCAANCISTQFWSKTLRHISFASDERPNELSIFLEKLSKGDMLLSCPRHKTHTHFTTTSQRGLMICKCPYNVWFRELATLLTSYKVGFT